LLSNNQTVDVFSFNFTLGGHGLVEINELYMVDDYLKEVPYRLYSFDYKIKIDNRYSLDIHYHPDSTCEKHAFVHLQLTKEKQKEVRVYLNPFPNFKMGK
jgi:hypothetical protein